MMNETAQTTSSEAPSPGDELMYVDLSREKLESLYKEDED